MSTLLRLEDLRKSIGDRLLLEIERFEIGEGVCLLLSGRNGAGKSTLLKIIAGLEAPDRSDVVYQGKTLRWRQARRQLQRDVVYLHQHPYLFDRSVEENVGYGLKLAGVEKKAIADKVAQALEWAGLTHLAGKNALRLSGGEKQRVALTRARVLSPKLLLLDEPFASMDLESRQQGLFFIRRLTSEGIGTIVTTHEPSVAQVLGDEHLHLCKTGPCRYTMVQPFLYERDQKRPLLPARGNRPPMPVPTDTVPSPAAIATAQQGGASGSIPKKGITGVILAGGKGRRAGGRDKGLLKVDGRPLISHIIDVVRPQVGSLVINANRNIDIYRALGYPVAQDRMGEFLGPLAGMASAMQDSDTPYLLSVPCDSPLVPADLCAKLYRALQAADADIGVAHDGTRMQPVFALLRRELLPDLRSYLDKGGRKIDTWYKEHRLALADFSDRPNAFLNINTCDELRTLEAMKRKACVSPPTVAPGNKK